MTSIIVRTREELELAKNRKIDEIIVLGELAEKLKKARKITKLSTAGLAILIGVAGIAVATAPVTAPVTAGLFALGAGAVGSSSAVIATLTGLDIATIITATSIGITLIIAVSKDYEEIECSNGRIVLKRKRKE